MVEVGIYYYVHYSFYVASDLLYFVGFSYHSRSCLGHVSLGSLSLSLLGELSFSGQGVLWCFDTS